MRCSYAFVICSIAIWFVSVGCGGWSPAGGLLEQPEQAKRAKIRECLTRFMERSACDPRLAALRLTAASLDRKGIREEVGGFSIGEWTVMDIGGQYRATWVFSFGIVGEEGIYVHLQPTQDGYEVLRWTTYETD